ncbi:MAG: pseudouridine synthase [Clostridia bacterium]|nr:pseudouridine synthase [Clostridia bacterium]
MRLQKYLADAGIASRRKCEELILAGRVTVNGETAAIGCVVDGSADTVCLDGKPVAIKRNTVAIMLNKPRGVICSATDPEGRRTVNDLLSGVTERVYNVGRLDVDSEGLILMTNDGDIAYRLTHPKHLVDKTYLAICSGEVSARDVEALKRGVVLEDGVTAPAAVEGLEKIEGGRSRLYITIHEGRNRQVRRMLAALGHDTVMLKRVKLGPLTLGRLKPGEWRYLTQTELNKLKHELGI